MSIDELYSIDTAALSECFFKFVGQTLQKGPSVDFLRPELHRFPSLIMPFTKFIQFFQPTSFQEKMLSNPKGKTIRLN